MSQPSAYGYFLRLLSGERASFKNFLTGFLKEDIQK
jgi:hypothetical protein